MARYMDQDSPMALLPTLTANRIPDSALAWQVQESMCLGLTPIKSIRFPCSMRILWRYLWHGSHGKIHQLNSFRCEYMYYAQIAKHLPTWSGRTALRLKFLMPLTKPSRMLPTRQQSSPRTWGYEKLRAVMMWWDVLGHEETTLAGAMRTIWPLCLFNIQRWEQHAAQRVWRPGGTCYGYIYHHFPAPPVAGAGDLQAKTWGSARKT